jgi:trimeric autotransporter adhesin
MRSTFHYRTRVFGLIALLVFAGLATARLALTEGPAGLEPAAELSSALTYQGYLTDGGGPANGYYDFSFALYDQPDDGAQLGAVVVLSSVAVEDGLFTVQLDFEQGGSPVFDGTALWLEIQVRLAGHAGPFITLAPRQPLTAAPYATYAARGSWAGLSGVPSDLADGDDDLLAGLSCGEGQIVAWLGGAWVCAETGGGAAGWSLTGNAGTTAGTNFLGTTDDEALELRVNGQPALRLEPDLNSPNFIAGYGGNSAGSGAAGATVGGGGRDLAANQANGNYSTVDGGAGNTAGGYASAVGGGEGNSAGGDYSLAGGGAANQAGGSYAVVGGGRQNSGGGSYAAVGGGQANVASGAHAVAGGGHSNLVSANHGAVAGGESNSVTAGHGTVGGGAYNSVAAGYGTISGGGPADPGNPTTSSNRVLDDYGTIGGGGNNQAGSSDGNAASATFAAVGGGEDNTAGATYATVAGGMGNQATGYGAGVAGGSGNSAAGNYAAVGGGTGNQATAVSSAVSGGGSNQATAGYGAVGGGRYNSATGAYGTVPGGNQNTAAGNYSLAAGQQATAGHAGAFVWSDSSGAMASTGANQFLIDADGGVGIGTDSPTEQLTVNGSAEILGSGHLALRSVFTATGKVLQNPSAVFASGTDIYVTSYATNTLSVIDATNLHAPSLVGYGTSQLRRPVDVFVAGQRAYVASQDENALVVFDVSDASFIDDALGDAGWGLAEPVAVYVSGNYAYVASQANDRLVVFDVTDPRHMFPAGFTTESLDAPSDVHVSGGFAYVTSRDNNALAIFSQRGDSVVDRASWDLRLVGFTSESLSGPSAVHVRGNQAFVLSEYNHRLVAFNISNKASIARTGEIATTLRRPRSLYVSGDYAYVTYAGDEGTSAACGLAVFDISDPENLQEVAVIDMSSSQPEPEKPVGVYGSGNYIYVVNERHWSLAIYEINHLQAPAATVGTVRAGYLEVNDNAVINNDLVVDGGLNVGSGGAYIGGELSVAGKDDSYIMGGLSIGAAAKTVSVTLGADNYEVLLTYPSHMLDVHGDARFRVNETSNLVLGTPRGFDEDASIDFIQAEQIDEVSLTEVISPSARIAFDAVDPLTHTTRIQFYTRAAQDTDVHLRTIVSSEGHLLPGGAMEGMDYNLGDAMNQWGMVYAKDGLVQLSDGRFKEDIAPLAYGLDEIAALQPVSFNWRDGPADEVHFGLVAQEAAQVLPELVEGIGGEGPLSFNYGELVPVLVNAIQEQQAQIEGQAGQIAALEARLAALEGAQNAMGDLGGLSPLWLGGLLLGGLAVGLGRHRIGDRR